MLYALRNNGIVFAEHLFYGATNARFVRGGRLYAVRLRRQHAVRACEQQRARHRF